MVSPGSGSVVPSPVLTLYFSKSFNESLLLTAATEVFCKSFVQSINCCQVEVTVAFLNFAAIVSTVLRLPSVEKVEMWIMLRPE
jgi:hypothetical protein